ncbi:hypothetical protein JXD20_02490 [Candidatus Peregrinibacteria bacterium]|nr:hypothetical protein [Candidatus Peregrinibacteria bacterium]
MPIHLHQIDSIGESLDSHRSPILHQVLERNRMTQTRREIGLIADRSLAERVISEEAYKGYRELAEGREQHQITAEMLESTRRFAKAHELAAIEIHRHIKLAVGQKIASKEDEKFLMKQLIISNHNFVNQAESIGALVDQKLERMRKDRDRYDKLANHPLIKDVGYLKVDGNTRIELPNLDKFLDMKVPDRRALLDKLEKVLSTAEAYAKECEQREDQASVEEYEAMLRGAMEEGIIGEHTFKSFLDGFKKIDHKEKEYWKEEFSNQMKPYRDLWSLIRASLRGKALEEMEAMRHNPEAGYSQLSDRFKELKISEAIRLEANYIKTLEKHRKEGIIGRRGIQELMTKRGQRKLEKQYEAEQQLPEQMESYRALWKQIETLPKKQQKFLRERIDEWGYDKLNQQYLKLAGKEDTEEQGYEEAVKQIRSNTVREAIVETAEILDGQSKQRQTAFIGLLDKMFKRANRDTFDASSFEGDIRGKTRKIDPTLRPDMKGRNAADEVDYKQIEGDTKILEQAGVTKVKGDLGFYEVESRINHRTTRQTQVTVNEERGIERLLSEDSKQSYRAEEVGGDDDLCLAVYSGGRTVELELNEVRLLQEALKKKAQNDNKETPRKAA